MDFSEKVFAEFDINNFVLALFTIITTVGTKYIYDDYDDKLEKVFQSKWMRRLYIFGFAYLASDDYRIAFLVLLLYQLFLKLSYKYFHQNDNSNTMNNNKANSQTNQPQYAQYSNPERFDKYSQQESVNQEIYNRQFGL